MSKHNKNKIRIKKAKRKVIIKTQTKDLTNRQAHVHFMRGLQQGASIALNKYVNKIQLKELAEDYVTAFGQKHPSHNWHTLKEILEVPEQRKATVDSIVNQISGNTPDDNQHNGDGNNASSESEQTAQAATSQDSSAEAKLSSEKTT